MNLDNLAESEAMQLVNQRLKAPYLKVLDENLALSRFSLQIRMPLEELIRHLVLVRSEIK